MIDDDPRHDLYLCARSLDDSDVRVLLFMARRLKLSADPMNTTTGSSALAHARWTAGMTTSELSEKSGVARSSIHRIESGRSVPNVKTLTKLAEALGLDRGELIDAYRGEGA